MTDYRPTFYRSNRLRFMIVRDCRRYEHRFTCIFAIQRFSLAEEN